MQDFRSPSLNYMAAAAGNLAVRGLIVRMHGIVGLAALFLNRPLSAHDGGAAAISTIGAVLTPIAIPTSLLVLRLLMRTKSQGVWWPVSFASLSILGILVGFFSLIRFNGLAYAPKTHLSLLILCMIFISCVYSVFAWFVSRNFGAAFVGAIYGLVAIPAFIALIFLFLFALTSI